MITKQLRLPDLSDDDNGTINRLLKQLDDYSRRNRLRAHYYDGRRAVHQVGSVIPPQYYRLGITLGWSAKAVDVLAQRCNLDRFVWPGGDLDSIGYGEVWEDNYLATEVDTAIVSALEFGVAFLVNTEGSDGEPRSLIHVKDALSATGDFNLRTRRMDNLISVIARDDEGNPTDFALYLNNRTVTARLDGRAWQTDQVIHRLGVPVDVVAHRPGSGKPFGRSRISRPVMSIHDSALRTLIRAEGHADVFSFPEMWMLGADAGVFKNADGSLKPSWQVMLGRIKGIPDDPDADPALARADIKQFQAHSPQPHIDLLQQHAANFSGETGIPITELGVQARTNTTTADGSDNSERSLVRTALQSMRVWDPSLKRVIRRALAIQNGLDEIPAEWSTIAPKWENPQYITPSAQADAGMKLLTAVPWLADTPVGLELLGLSEQQITRAMSEKRRTAGARTVLDAIAQRPNGFAVAGP